MRLLVTGADGQLGRELMGWRPSGVDVIGVGKSGMDVTDQDLVASVVSDCRPDAVIHAAALTAVDAAEADPDAAYAVNTIGTRNVAVACAKVGARLCYISTDYVFAGDATVPYGEFDPPAPRTVYGKSKYAGEVLVRSLCNRWFIVRTAWVYGRYGNNFVHSLLATAAHRQTLRVVNDQTGSPTYAKDLVALLLTLVATEKYGIYHATNSGACTWYEFARAIVAVAGVDAAVEPCSTAESARPALRPPNSTLSQTQLRVNGFEPLRPWQDALAEFLSEMRGQH